MDNSKDSGSQPVLFMGTQTENLEYMYKLVHELSNQLQENKKLRDSILEDMDTLAKRANRGSTEISADINVAQQFIDQRIIASRPANGGGGSGGDGGDDDIDIDNANNPTNESYSTLEHVTRQNKQLKEILSRQQGRNTIVLGVLREHDENLQRSVTLLRDEIHMYHMTIIKWYRDLANKTLFEAEDAQFRSYLDSISDLQQLLDLSRVYRALLQLHP
ncbi:hypothetical protein C6P41_000814 [Kluyveromyces marxianus]|nr:hypothetical protein C6P43_003375 [Kluyveromyces marxianus]KAG0685168.1 hypothetical protein C6P41_000814 [Kluyveromyces marxianus]